MRNRFFQRLTAACLALASLVTPCFAETSQTASIPVTLTVINSVRCIDVTIPVSMPVCVYNGKVLTADNLSIINNSSDMIVEITDVSVLDGTYQIVTYEGFKSTRSNQLALEINGCMTEGDGSLAITDTAFPDIEANADLPINYSAKVSGSLNNILNDDAASVVFTLKAAPIS